MSILAFDTSGNACSAALWRDGAVVAREHRAMERGHTEALLPMIARVLEAADTGYDALERLAVTVGPGSFTGVRAGLAAARGIALARSLPVLGIDCFATVLWGASRAMPDSAAGRARLIALDSRRKEVYLRIFSPVDTPLSPPDMMAPDDIAPRIAALGADDGPVALAGSAAAALAPVLAGAGIEVVAIAGFEAPDAADLAMLAASRIASDEAGDAESAMPAPLYLHPPYAVRPAAGGRLRP